MKKQLNKKIKLISTSAGVYLFRDKLGQILYIGKAVNLRNRVRSHFVRGHLFSNEKIPPSPPLQRGGENGKGNLYRDIKDIETITTANENEALILENQLIKKYKPKYNIQWRDDKSYNWVVFTDDEWPRVQVAHQTKIQNPLPARLASENIAGRQPSLKGESNINNSPPLESVPGPTREGVRGDLIHPPIGPFTSGRELKQVLRQLRKVLPYRTCKNAYDKPCLQWHLGLCPAHEQLLSKRRVPSTPPLQKGGSDVFFEKTSWGDLKNYLSSLNTLAQLLRLYAGQNIRIEAYDISNIQGTNATGSMIVFAGDQPDKSQYRRFRIKTVRGANDVAMLKEVLRRRLTHTEWPAPDLILIDGGRPQLGAALASVAHRPHPSAIISLAKQQEEIFTAHSPRSLRIKNLPLSFQLTLQAIRNEAHRFAISYYRKLHRKKLTLK